jgi:hypothetical protein
MEALFKSQETFAWFLIFFVPGFISMMIYDLCIPAERRDFSKSLFEAIAYSSLNFAALLWLIDVVRSDSLKAVLWYISMFLLLIGMPAAWPLLLLQIRRLPMVARRFPSPNARVWDDIFAKRKPYWVIVYLKDDRRIGGLYGGNSFTSHSPAPPEIYLEQAWHVDDKGFTGAMVKETSGVLILGSDIQAIEFFQYNLGGVRH